MALCPCTVSFIDAEGMRHSVEVQAESHARGRSFGGRRDLAGQILGGWQVNGVLVLETGLPMHPTQSLKPVDDGCPRCTHRPDRIRDGRLSGSERTLDRWFDTGAFVQVRDTPANRYGNSGRNILTAPGLVNLDL